MLTGCPFDSFLDIHINFWVRVGETICTEHTHHEVRLAFHLWTHTERVQVYCTAPGWINGGRIRCPSHEKTLALINLFISFAYSEWVLSWQLALTVLTQAHGKSVLWGQRKKKEYVPIGGGVDHDYCMKGSSVCYRCRKRRCSTGNVMAEEDKQKACLNFSFSWADSQGKVVWERK